MNKTRVCKKCGEEYPEIKEFFRLYDGRYFSNICRKCIRKHNKEYLRQHKDKRNEWQRNYNKTESGKEYRKRYYDTHKEEKQNYNKEYRKENRDEIIKRHRKWYAKNRDRLLAIRRDWNNAHRDELREYWREYNATHAEGCRRRSKTYRIKHKEKCTANAQIRRARKKAAPTGLTESDWEYAIQYFENKCAYCGSEMNKPTREHIVPLVSGGGYTRDNIIPVCLHCNLSKNKKTLGEWYPKQPFYSEEREENIKKYIKRMVGK